MSNVSIIVGFLRVKGLNDAQIAGVLGNMSVESGFSPTASNAAEGAIGLAQWEGGRRIALQQYAAVHGSTERDINMQLGYLWRELQTSEHGAYNSLLSAQTASDAATAWDVNFERSAGTTRQQRIEAAQRFADTLGAGGVPTSADQNSLPDSGTGQGTSTGTMTGDPSGSHTDAFAINHGQSLAELHAQQQQQQELLQQIDYVTGQGPKPTLHATTPSGTEADRDTVNNFLSAARGELGESYVFGAKADAGVAHPHALDCSGLTKWAAERVGAHLPDGAGYQYLALKKAGMLIPVDQAMHTPGALLFHFAAEPQPGQGEPAIAHVAISTGKATTIEAADDKDGIVSWSAKGRFNYAAIIPGIGTPDPSGAAQALLDADHTVTAAHADHGGAHAGVTDDLSSVHTWSGHEWHWFGSDLGSGTGTGTGTGTDITGGPEFDDHGGWDAGHH